MRTISTRANFKMSFAYGSILTLVLAIEHYGDIEIGWWHLPQEEEVPHGWLLTSTRVSTTANC